MIYFDNNATTAAAPEVLDAMMPFLAENFGNPSSSHTAGRTAKRAVDSARESVADLIGAASPDEIVFTATGSESDNWAINGALEANPDRRHVITTRVEHEAVRKLCERLETRGIRLTWLDVDEDGSLDLGQLRDSLDAETAVVSVMLANNETGVLFPVAEVAAIVKERSNALVHVDGVNAVGKVPVDLSSSGIDLFSLSGHKFHAPKGIGALYVRKGVELPSVVVGGGQEGGRRAGTEAVHQIAALGAAATLATDPASMSRVRLLRDRLESAILDSVPNAYLNGTSDTSKRLPNTSSISFENANGEMIMARLDELGVCVSTGSACNSQGHTASAVLQAMNVPYSRAMGAIRFSLGRYNTEAEVDFVIERLPGIVKQVRGIAGV